MIYQSSNHPRQVGGSNAGGAGRHRAIMKTLRIILFVIVGVVVFVSVRRQSAAQPAPATADQGNLGKYERLVIPLIQSGQTNLVSQISDLVSEMHAEQKTIDIAMSVRMLQDLRAGRTNEVIRLLETRLDGALVGYDMMPHTAAMDKVVAGAKQYREQFPHTSSNPNVDAGVARAFNSLSR